MRYFYEYKSKCVELYRQGKWTETPAGIKEVRSFHNMIRRWVRNTKLWTIGNSGQNKMDAPCKIQGGIHVPSLIHQLMCSEFRIHITNMSAVFLCIIAFCI